MKHVLFPQVNKSFNIPENLSECQGKDYMKICHLVMEYYAGMISYNDFKTLALAYFFNLKKNDKPNEESLVNLRLLSEIIDSFFEDSNENKKLKLDFLDTKIPKIRTIFKTYFGPEDSFMDLTYGQYTDAVKVFLQFSNTREVALLYDLAAILYRRKQNGKKEMYDSESIATKAKSFRKYTPFGFVAGVYFQFAAFMKYLPEAVISLDGITELDFSILYQTSDENTILEKTPGIGVDSVVLTLAEVGIFGNVKEVRNTPFWEIQLALYELRRKDLELQKQYSDAKNKST